MKKRRFIQSMLTVPVLASMNLGLKEVSYSRIKGSEKRHPLKISLNAYSFDEPLSEGNMDLNELLVFCADHQFDALDPTAYYFPGYPEVPSDRYLYNFKQKAFLLGLEISGTGVKNDFTDPDDGKRKKNIKLVKNWILAAEKMGIPVIRIFSGTQSPAGFSWEQIAEWISRDIRECVEFGKSHGVMVAIQNHNDFIKTAGQVERLIHLVDSPWFGLILDTGSYATRDPYQEIADSIPYAVSWQVKEKINRMGKEEDVDLDKLMSIIKSSGYRGYLPIETLGPGDPFQKVPLFLKEMRLALSKENS